MSGIQELSRKHNGCVLLIISNSLFLVNKLIKEINIPDLLVVVVSNDKDGIEDLNNNILLKNVKDVVDNFYSINYIIYLKSYEKSSFTNNKRFLNLLKKDTRTIDRLIGRYKCKTIFAFSGIRGASLTTHFVKKYNSYINKIITSCSVVIYGDLIDLSINNNSLSDLQSDLVKISLNKKVSVAKKRPFYPLLDSELISYLLKILFSLKAYGKTTFITGRPLSYESFKKAIGNEALLSLNKNEQYGILPHEDKIISNKQSKTIILKLYKRLLKDVQMRKAESIYDGRDSKTPHSLSTDNVKFNFIILGIKNIGKFLVSKKKYILTGSIITALVVPVLLIFLSLLFQSLTMYFFNKNFLKPALVFSKTSFYTSGKNRFYVNNLKRTPYLGEYFKLYTKPVDVINLQSELLLKGLEIADNLTHAIRGVVLGEEYNVNDNLRATIFGLDYLYQKLGFLESETAGNNDFTSEYIKYFYKNESIASLRNKTEKLRNLVQDLHELSYSGDRNILAIIFQNSTILRPTGGSIETISVLNLNGLVIEGEIVTEDASWVDRNTYSMIEPPFALKKYFGVDNWYFKESNWGPDFPSTATRMNTLLNENLNIPFKGIILIDKNFVFELQEILEGEIILGNISNTSYEKINYLNYPNNYQENQLTDSLKKMFKQKYELDDKKIIQTIKIIYKHLNNRNIQIYHEDGDIQKNLNSLNWDGSIINDLSSKTHFYDFVSLIESTIEGNRKETVRESQMSVYFQEGIVKRKLNFYIENRGDTKYKTYLRLFANSEVGFSPAVLKTGENEKVLNMNVGSAKGLKEQGVFIEANPGEVVRITFEWEGPSDNSFDNSGEYQLYWRKQAGADAFPVEILFSFPEEAAVFSDPITSLTKDGVFLYNMDLDRDLNPRIFW